jgi:hypothetical protein
MNYDHNRFCHHVSFGFNRISITIIFKSYLGIQFSKKLAIVFHFFNLPFPKLINVKLQCRYNKWVQLVKGATHNVWILLQNYTLATLKNHHGNTFIQDLNFIFLGICFYTCKVAITTTLCKLRIFQDSFCMFKKIKIKMWKCLFKQKSKVIFPYWMCTKCF